MMERRGIRRRLAGWIETNRLHRFLFFFPLFAICLLFGPSCLCACARMEDSLVLANLARAYSERAMDIPSPCEL